MKEKPAPVTEVHLKAASALFDATVLVPQPKAIDRIAQHLANLERKTKAIHQAEAQIVGNLDRWMEISATTPSGKTQFVCLSCGRLTPAPTKTCPSPVRHWSGSLRECTHWDPPARMVLPREEIGLKRAMLIVQKHLHAWPPFDGGYTLGKRILEDLGKALEKAPARLSKRLKGKTL